ncbi:MAG: isoprenylcysteine carboxylmethyltransferase family protein [Candidatus Omnitrophica bacterium]|nr:isoprenylcysteine carboxylmethyltransferase family protein [Candidatus Omnitrophota bacterium]
MIDIVEFLVKRGKKEHGVAVRTLATLLGAILFLVGMPAFVFWMGNVFMRQPIMPELLSRIISGVSFAVGVPWMVWAIAWQLVKGKGTPVPVVPTKHFLNNGPYRFVRNPMMLGFFLYLLGWALWRNQWGFLISAIGVKVLLCFEIKFIEEPELVGRFGDAYREYKKETPFIFPNCIRNCLERNKIFFETITATSLSIMAIIISVQANKIASNQLALSQEPVIRVVPEKTVIGNNVASFTLSLKNAGLSNIIDIEIYEDYFVAQKLPDKPISLNRFGIFSIQPNHIIPVIKKGEAKDFQIEFKEIHKQMLDFFLSDAKGYKAGLLRLIVRYNREIDGREFSFAKVFFIDFSGKVLLDSYPRGIEQEFFSIEEVKAALGIR